MRPISLQTFALAIGFGVLACSPSAESDDGDNLFGTGGFTSTGGVAQGTGGFVSGTGGLVQGTGGFVQGTGGALASGGSLATGGQTETGGVTATGGLAATGGVSATGGASATGGVTATGGTVSTGGVIGATGGSSGSCTNVRPTGTQWDEATCDMWANQTSECGNAWMIDNNYCNESCGRCSGSGSGGTTSTGGTASTGGTTSTGGQTSSCSASDLQVCNNQTGTHCGYTYEYWKDSGTGCLTNTDDGFSVTWSGINNLLGRKGIRPGSKTQVVEYSANYQPNGNSYLCVYGWTTGPLIEYYIVDSWGSWRPPGGQSLGTVQSDGGTYDIYKTERVNQPSIEGQKTFFQYWSVRQSKRSSGTITVANHFNAWAAKDMNLGALYEVSMTVEGYQSSGSADVSFSMH